jgi:hypothetical protein
VQPDDPPIPAADAAAAAAEADSGEPGKHRHHWFKRLHGHHQLSSVLRELAAHQEATIPFGAMIDALGARAHGMALLILILPEAIPMPIPSAGAVLGVPLILVAAHLVLFGEHAGIPERVRSINMPVSALRAVVRYLGPVLDFLENLARPRWLVLARSERISGAVCLYLALLLFLPIPFLNFPQALCLAAIALGMVMRDGIFVAAGYVGTAVLTGSLIAAAEMLRRQFFG